MSLLSRLVCVCVCVCVFVCAFFSCLWNEAAAHMKLAYIHIHSFFVVVSLSPGSTIFMYIVSKVITKKDLKFIQITYSI